MREDEPPLGICLDRVDDFLFTPGERDRVRTTTLQANEHQSKLGLCSGMTADETTPSGHAPRLDGECLGRILNDRYPPATGGAL
jgi:hypothetical protein